MAASGRSLLTLDRGNRSLDALWRGAGAEHRARLDPDEPEVLAVFLGDRQVHRAVGATVVADGLQGAAQILEGRGVRLELVPRDLPMPLASTYRTPEALGIDRLLAALAARSMTDGAAVVVDCGSAVTVDLVDRDGVFQGGFIAPGLRAMASALAAAAPLLPPPDLVGCPAPVPKTTAEAVTGGVVGGFRALVQGLVATLAAQIGEQPVVLVTGGDAARVGGSWDVVPDLVHRGLALCAGEVACGS